MTPRPLRWVDPMAIPKAGWCRGPSLVRRRRLAQVFERRLFEPLVVQRGKRVCAEKSCAALGVCKTHGEQGYLRQLRESPTLCQEFGVSIAEDVPPNDSH